MNLSVELKLHATPTRRHAWLARAAGAALLALVSVGAHAASIYQCVRADGRLTYRDTPCATHARQAKLEVSGQPLIDPGAPRATPDRVSNPRTYAPSRRAHVATRQQKPPMSWECHAADGEVFYRHARCPGSVPSDGMVRDDWTNTRAKPRGRRSNARSRVSVHGTKVSRADACQHIRAITASSRDGYQRDQNVSVYDHLMGRDPCS